MNCSVISYYLNSFFYTHFNAQMKPVALSLSLTKKRTLLDRLFRIFQNLAI